MENILKYHKDLSITNTESLPRGLGARYLLCLVSHKNTYIAKQWKRKIPEKIQDGHVLIDFQATIS